MEKQQPNNGKGKVVKPAPRGKLPAPAPVAPLFRRIDWIVMGVVFAVIWAIYLFTLAPELTLEDSGELCTGSYYAGIPHPPGYPFWAIYSWLWTVILPIGNVAWRVEVGESFGIAMGCGMLALMVSRGSSMLIEGIEELRIITSKWEGAICMVSGFVAGMLAGLDGFVWSEADVINRISVFAVPWLILVLLMLMRWMYAPHQKRYIYLALLFYGICATIHQTLLLSAVGIEVAIALVQPKLGRDAFLFNSLLFLGGLYAMQTHAIPAFNNMSGIEKDLFYIVGAGSLIVGGWLSVKTGAILTEWKTGVIMLIMWILGVSFYFYEPISGMTVPPMQWGYPRTVEGFFHALSRGQYDTTQGYNPFTDPVRFFHQLQYIVQGLAESFNWVFLFIGLLPFLFLLKMHKRERSWIIGLSSVYTCIAVLLVILLNVGQDRSSQELNKVFFTASHGLFAIMIGYGLTLMAAYMATHYANFRFWGLAGVSVAILLAIYNLADAAANLYVGPGGDALSILGQLPHLVAQSFAQDQYGLPIYANLILVTMPIVFLLALLVYRKRGPVLILLGLFMIMPVYSGLSHWYKSEQRNHWFGYWFGHDMFTPPFGIYPEMTRDTILFGGTDPGRFNPTYMIFCESFIPHSCQPKEDQKFDRRDVYLITQNALADGTYLDYLRSQYFRSAQHDPPFFSVLLAQWWWVFVGLALGLSAIWIAGELIQNAPHLKRNAIIIGSAWGIGLVIVLFQGQGIKVDGLSMAAYQILDVPFTKWGAHVEARRRAEGVYPPAEIYIPSPEDLQQCYDDYREDFQRRAALNQLQPNEGIQASGGQMTINGQISVMKINGLLCKVIFDHNPTNEFFIEESFPLDWMYPYETPFGIIMKVNRQPLPELSDDVFKKDHAFWEEYSRRFIGNWITYDTSLQQIADFAERVYLHGNFHGFTGDRKFVRDDDGQKAFSKLRSSQAGVYAWRLNPQCPPEYRQKTPEAQEALRRETDFAFKQAFAFCPYSPEAVFRYANFLLQYNRLDDALIVAKTYLKFDPYNGQAADLVKNIEDFKARSAGQIQLEAQVRGMETEQQNNPTNFQNTLELARFYLQIQQTNRAVELLRNAMKFFDPALANPNLSASDVGAMAQIAAQMGDMSKLEILLQKLARLLPDQPEPFYNLAALDAIEGKTSDALKNLQTALDLYARWRVTNPAARDLRVEARKDPRFDSLRNLPAFQKLVPPD